MTAPKTIAQTIAANLRTDVTVANGAPIALAHAYSGRRKSYDWQSGPVAIVLLGEHGIDEKRYTLGGGGRKRIHYGTEIDLVWVNPDVEDAATDNIKPSDDFLSLIESVKASLRKHTSLGGLVLKCAEEDIKVERPVYVPQNVPHWESALLFEVLDEIVAAPIG